MNRLKRALKRLLLSISHFLLACLSYLGLDPEPLQAGEETHKAMWHYRFIRYGARKGWWLWFIFLLNRKIEEGINNLEKIFSIRWWFLGFLKSWADAEEELSKSYNIFSHFVLYPFQMNMVTENKTLEQIDSEREIMCKNLLDRIKSKALSSDFFRSVDEYRASYPNNSLNPDGPDRPAG